MNKKWAFFVSSIIITLGLLVSLEKRADAFAPDKNQDLKKMIDALKKEKDVLVKQKQKQDERERRLVLFEKDLEKKNKDNQKGLKEIENREKALQKKIDDLSFDKQIIETYETVDAEQAARLILDLYKKDPVQVARLMRRLPGEKAGEVLNAMIVLEPDNAAILAKKVLDYYKVEKKQKQ